MKHRDKRRWFLRNVLMGGGGFPRGYMPAAPGTFILTGQDATLTYVQHHFTLAAASGSFTLTGQDATLTSDALPSNALLWEDNTGVKWEEDGNFIQWENGVYSLAADAGAFTLTGQAATLTYTQVSLLLDALNGSTQVLGAYGLRKLRSAYSGYCLKVQRLSDNATQDIGFSGTNLDTSAITSFLGSNQGAITTWYDQSSAGKDLTQATAANMPRLTDGSGTIYTAIGSKPVIYFDSSGSTRRFLRNTSFSTASGDNTKFGAMAIFRPTSLTDFQWERLVALGNGTTDNGGAYGAVISPYGNRFFSEHSGSYANSPTTLAINTNFACTALWPSGVGSLNGSAGSADANSAAWTGTDLRVGAGYGSDATDCAKGYVGDIIVFGNLVSGDQSVMETDSRTFYGF